MKNAVFCLMVVCVFLLVMMGCAGIQQSKAQTATSKAEGADNGVIKIIVVGNVSYECSNEAEYKKAAMNAAKEALRNRILCEAAQVPPGTTVKGDILQFHLLYNMTIKEYHPEEHKVVLTLWIVDDDLKKFMEENVKFSP